MCGILGLIDKNKSISSKKFSSALKLQNSRGPDNTCVKNFHLKNINLFFGHNRLKIIDLSNNANQPMVRDGFTLIFNGEIYNYIELRNKLKKIGFDFITNSDTEVILYSWMHWGDACLKKFDGMFSFAIFDEKNNKIFLARDTFGIKPFYFYIDKNKFCFASSPDTLSYLVDKRKINSEVAKQYFQSNKFLSSSLSFYDQIYQLPPGNLGIINLNDFSNPGYFLIKNWNTLKDIKEDKISFRDSVDGVRHHFLQSVKRSLRSDVDVGFTLSGGVDSSAVVCASRYLEKDLDINTFSYIDSNKNFSELERIDIVNKFVKANSNKVYFQNQKINSITREFIEQIKEPTLSSGYLVEYQIFKLAHEKGFKVMIEGHGGDEVTCGYSGYLDYLFADLLKKGKLKSILEILKNWNTHALRSRKSILKNFLLAVLNTYSYKFENDYKLDSSEFIKLDKSFPKDNNSILKTKLIKQLSSESIPPQLIMTDRSSMSFSIESRVPFLSLPFVEFMMTIPSEFFVSNKGKTKYLFKEAFRDIVPNEILDERIKLGYACSCLPRLKISKNVNQKTLSFIKSEHSYLKKYLNPILESNESSYINLDKKNWKLINFIFWIFNYMDL